MLTVLHWIDCQNADFGFVYIIDLILPETRYDWQ